MATPTAPAAQIVGSLRSADGAGIVRLQGRFDTYIAEVWSALTDPDCLSRWLGEVEGELSLGGQSHARFFATGWEGTLRVQACEPTQRFLVQTKSPGEPDCVIEAILTAAGQQTIVCIEDRGLSLDQIAAYGAGDQVLVEDLAAYLAGHERSDPQLRWKELHPAYQELAAGLD